MLIFVGSFEGSYISVFLTLTVSGRTSRTDTRVLWTWYVDKLLELRSLHAKQCIIAFGTLIYMHPPIGLLDGWQTRSIYSRRVMFLRDKEKMVNFRFVSKVSAVYTRKSKLCRTLYMESDKT